ncbi:MAG: hypothetical protein F9K29_15290 [Hyphomicrobiaceae bacterium]|nr:MAG: hypothetical protein F9K29_15290 [Hyphomicrobiaceae bacterium]
MTQPAPLTRPQLERLWRWERNMIRYYAMAMTLIAAVAAVAVAYGDIPWVRRSMLALILLLVLAATIVQFRERCPRCGRRIGSQSRLLLPDKCKGCGVKFERPPKLDSELDN